MKTAVSLGIGRPSGDIRLLKGEGDEKFEALINAVKKHAGFDKYGVPALYVLIAQIKNIQEATS